MFQITFEMKIGREKNLTKIFITYYFPRESEKEKNVEGEEGTKKGGKKEHL